MQDDKSTYKQLVYPALGACQEGHKQLGPFLNEYMYQDALAIEFTLRNRTVAPWHPLRQGVPVHGRL